jgi:hypothetical protein
MTKMGKEISIQKSEKENILEEKEKQMATIGSAIGHSLSGGK